MFRFLLPKEVSFFKYFEEHGKISIDVCKELLELSSEGDIKLKIGRIRDLEHKADDIAHQCIEALHKTFITPIDRADIHHLIKKLDDIVDAINSAAKRIDLYELKVIRPEVKEIAEVLLRAAHEVTNALSKLENTKNADAILQSCKLIYEEENKADDILRKALSRLFKEEKDIMFVIKWKEIFETLERATDHCENVANIIEGIVIEAS